MTTSLSPSDWAVQRLNAYCFETIWNAVPGEYTVNAALAPVGPRAVSGSAILGGISYSLPDGNLYLVYAVGYSSFRNANLLVSDTWTRSDIVLSQRQTVLSVYSDTGYTVPRSSVYLYRPSYSPMVLVAVLFSAAAKIYTTSIPSLYITAYRNPNRSVVIQSWSYTLPTPITTSSSAAVNAQIASCLSSNANGTMVFWNGMEIDPTQTLPGWSAGDLVDVLFDPGIFTAYDAIVMNLNAVYLSTVYNESRDLLHCPKANNPNNWILTHEAAYFSVWDAATRKGVRVPRLDPYCVRQLTHCDWSITHSVLQALKTAIASTDIIVRVRVRTPNNPHMLQPTASLLQALYECSDNEITAHLLGNIDDKATFWAASTLEQNPYASLMFKTPSGTDTAVLTTYRDALGYHEMTSILGCSAQTNLTGLPNIVVNKPYYLYTQSGYASVFLGGMKIDSSLVTLQDLPQGKLSITLASSVSISSGATLAITQYENANFSANTIVNATTGVVAVTASPYPSVYVLTSFATPMLGWDGTVITEGYVKLAAGVTTYQVYPSSTGTGYDVSIYSAIAGETLYIADDIFINVDRIDLDPILAAESPLIFPLTQTDAESNKVPILNYATVEVYINGLRLAEGLDFNLLSWTDPTTGAIGRVDVVIANQSFFNPSASGNYLEIITHSSIQSSQDVSYVLGQVIRRQVTPSFWNDGLSRCFVEGVWDFSAVSHTDWFTVTDQPEGGVAYWDTLIHRRLYEMMKAYDAVSDYTNRTIVDKVLNHVTPPIPSTINLTSQHRLYSPYLASIIADVVAGTLILVDDPDITRFLNQFSQYLALKLVDPCLATYNGPINVSYVAVAAHYANYTITSPDVMKLVQKLISYTLTPALTLGDVLI